MTKKFDPAARDKHAESAREATQADRKTHSELDAGLIGSFPASDPASSVQPSTAKNNNKNNNKNTGSREDASLLRKLRAAFR